MKKLIFLMFLFLIPSVYAGVNLPWSTTYDCDTWTQSDGLTEGDVNCDNLAGGGGWECDGTGEETISTASNYSGGGGGKGQRHLFGDTENNSNSGGLFITFNTPQSEIWIRIYVRFQAGFNWISDGNALKMLYFEKAAGNMMPFYFPLYGDDGGVYTASDDAPDMYSCSDCSWVTHSMGSGDWMAIEVHIKAETVATGDGEFDIWVNGVNEVHLTNVDFGMDDSDNYITGVLMGSNAGELEGLDGCEYLDYDDIAINNTGYIGLLSSESKDVVKLGVGKVITIDDVIVNIGE